MDKQPQIAVGGGAVTQAAAQAQQGRIWKPIDAKAMHGQGPASSGYDFLLENTSTHEKRWQPAFAMTLSEEERAAYDATEKASQLPPGIFRRKSKDGKKNYYYKEAWTPREVSGVPKQAFNEAVKGAGQFAAHNPIPTVPGQLLGLWELQFMAQNALMERGQEAEMERGLYPDHLPNDPSNMQALAHAMRVLKGGVSSVGYDAYRRISGQQGHGHFMPGVEIPQEFRALERGPQLAAAMQLWRNLKANKKDTAEERRRVAKIAHALPKQNLLDADQQDKDESVMDTFGGGRIGEGMANYVFQDGANLFQGNNRMQWAGEKIDKHLGVDDRMNNDALDNQLVGGSWAGGGNAYTWGILGKELGGPRGAALGALAGFGAGVGAGVGGDTAYSYFADKPYPKNPSDHVDRAKNAGVIGSNIVPPVLGGAANLVSKGWNRYSPSGRKASKMMTEWTKPVNQNAEAVRNLNFLHQKGLISAPMKAELLEHGPAWLDALAAKNPELGAKAKHLIDMKMKEVKAGMQNEGGGAGGERVLDSSIREANEVPVSDISVGGFRSRVNSALERYNKARQEEYNPVLRSHEMQEPIPRAERRLIADDMRSVVSADEMGGDSSIHRLVEHHAQFLEAAGDVNSAAIFHKRKKLRSDFGLNENPPYSPLVGAAKQVDAAYTKYLKTFAENRSEALGRVEARYAEMAQTREAVRKHVNAFAQGQKPVGEASFAEKLVNKDGVVDKDFYANLVRAFAVDPEGVGVLNNFVGQQIAKRITNNDEGGKKLLKIIDENFDFLSSPSGLGAPYNNNGRAFDIVAKAIRGKVSRLAKSSSDIGQKGVSFVGRMTDEDQAQRVIGAFKKMYGDEDGMAVLRWLETQHILRAKSPSEYFKEHKTALGKIYTPEQMETMGALSFAYENTQKFDFRKYLASPGDAPVDDMVGKAADKLKSEFGVTPAMLASNLKLWITRVQGNAFIATSAAMRYFNAQNSKRAFEILLSEASKDEKVLNALVKRDWTSVPKSQAKNMWIRMNPAFRGLETETQGDRDRLSAEQKRKEKRGVSRDLQNAVDVVAPGGRVVGGAAEAAEAIMGR